MNASPAWNSEHSFVKVIFSLSHVLLSFVMSTYVLSY